MAQPVFDKEILIPETDPGLGCKQKMCPLLLEPRRCVSCAHGSNNIRFPSLINDEVVLCSQIETNISAIIGSVDVGSPWLGKNSKVFETGRSFIIICNLKEIILLRTPDIPCSVIIVEESDPVSY